MNKTKKLLVVSDNHGSGQEIRWILDQYQDKIDAFVHCGDSTWNPDLFDSVLNCPVYCAKGNCDWDFIDHEGEPIFEFAGHTIFVTHGHYYGVNWGLDELAEKAQEVGADIVFYGHTHVPDYEEYVEEGITIMNPGSCARPRQMNPQRTFMIVEFYDDGTFTPQFFTV